MGQAFAARYRQSAPIVTYGVTPRAEQRAPKANESEERSLAWNISGAVPAAAALALGALAFVTTSDLPQDERSDKSFGSDDISPETSGPAVRVAIPTIPLQSPVALDDRSEPRQYSAGPSPIASPSVKASGSWQPATPHKRQYEMAASPAHGSSTEAEALAPRTRSIEELAPLQIGAASAPVQSAKSIPAKKWLATAIRQAPEPAGARPDSLSVEIAMAPPASTPPTPPAGRDYIRRDYSNTLAGTGAARDTRLGADEAAQLAAATAPPSISGQPSPKSVQLVDGELASVKLGEVLKLVETQMDPDEYAALANSASANSYVGPEMMQDAGIQASFDAQTFTLALAVVS